MAILHALIVLVFIYLPVGFCQPRDSSGEYYSTCIILTLGIEMLKKHNLSDPY